MRFLLITAFFLICLSACTHQPFKRVCFTIVCVKAEIADTAQKRSEGLMFRGHLAEKEAMFFVFPEEDRFGFWMKNMRFPLDLIWVSSDKKVVDISKNLSVCSDEVCPSFNPADKVKYVLEVNAGFTDKYKIQIGDEVNFSDDFK